MMRDKADDPFAVGLRQALARVRKPLRQPVDPDAAIRIEHDLDDTRIFEPCRYRGCPNAVCSIRAPRVIASDRRECVPMNAPARHGHEMQPMNGND